MPVSTDSLMLELDQVQEDFRKYFEKADAKAVIENFYTPDALYKSESMEVSGRADLETFFQSALDSGMNDVIWKTENLIQLSDDLVCQIVDLDHLFKDGSNQPARVLMIFKKEQGRWLCKVDFVA